MLREQHLHRDAGQNHTQRDHLTLPACRGWVCMSRGLRERDRDRQREKNQMWESEPTLPGGGRLLGQHTWRLPFQGLSRGHPDSLAVLTAYPF